jgi:hypothetical protein
MAAFRHVEAWDDAAAGKKPEEPCSGSLKSGRGGEGIYETRFQNDSSTRHHFLCEVAVSERVKKRKRADAPQIWKGTSAANLKKVLKLSLKTHAGTRGLEKV